MSILYPCTECGAEANIHPARLCGICIGTYQPEPPRNWLEGHSCIASIYEEDGHTFYRFDFHPDPIKSASQSS